MNHPNSRDTKFGASRAVKVEVREKGVQEAYFSSPEGERCSVLFVVRFSLE